METPELKKIIKEIGDSVHSMNTIAVSLSLLNAENCVIPNGLDISWNPSDIEQSKIKARSYAERAAIVYSVESFFEYLDSISKHPLWRHEEINFKGEEKKAIKVYNFLSQIPTITIEMAILSELACHWRNKIVHANISNAKLSSTKTDKLKESKEKIFENFYHFNVEIALENLDRKKITLKDSSTLITILIKSARLIDEFFFNELSVTDSLNSLIDSLKTNPNFDKIVKLQESEKRNRQILKFIEMTFPFLEKNMVDKIYDKIKTIT